MQTTRRTIRRPAATLLAGAVAATCTACAIPGHVDGIGDDGYRAIFSRVIERTLADAKGDNVCLPGIVFNRQGVDVFVDSDPSTPAAPRGRLAQMQALETIGFVVRTDGVRGNNNARVATFRATDRAAPFVNEQSLCYARAVFDRVVKWKGPIALGDYRAAFVYYTTKTGAVAEWARSPEIVAAFPTVAANVAPGPAKERQVAIDKSSEGWDVAEYSKLLKLD